jgi:hypothetical protein
VLKVINLDFWVSQFCGDNYRVAVTNDPIFLTTTRNQDKFDGQKIVNNCPVNIPGGFHEIDKSLCSPVLTVWRTLHIEYDLMTNPTWEDNLIIRGYFRGFGGGHLNVATSINSIFCDACVENPIITFNPNQPLKDYSLVAPNGIAGFRTNGRFEGGGIRIYSPPVEVGVPNINGVGAASVIASNTVNSVSFTIPQDLTRVNTPAGIIGLQGVISGIPPLPDLVFNIFDIEVIGAEFNVVSTAPIPNLGAYNGGNIRIGGGPLEVGVVSSPTVDLLSFRIPKDNLKIPVEIRDDDNIVLGGQSIDIQPVNFNMAQAALSNVYINVVDDGGGDPINSQNGVDFYKNLKGESNALGDPYALGYREYNNNPVRRLSTAYGGPNYWVIYVLSGWQGETYNDSDPASEGAAQGLSLGASVDDCLVAPGGDFILFNHSSVSEAILFNPANSLDFAFGHELGHCLGLTHGNLYNLALDIPNRCLGFNAGPVGAGVPAANLSVMGIMAPGNFNLGGTNFIPYHTNIIRSRIQNPNHN